MSSLIYTGEAKLSTTSILEPKLTVLKKSLTSSILHALSDPNLRKNFVLEYTALLQRLHASPADKNTFLAARAELTRKRIRMIKAEGHIPMYIADLAVVVFTGIRHTAEWYLSSFRQHDAGSCKDFCVYPSRRFLTMFSFSFSRQFPLQPSSSGRRNRLKYSQSCFESRSLLQMSIRRRSMNVLKSRMTKARR